MEDTMIVDLYLERDEAAITETGKKYGRRLFYLASTIVRDMETAEECENDTYMQAWNSIPPHSPREYLYAFLARITRHISLNHCRNRARLKRYAHISELTAEMEECIPAPDDVECRLAETEFADMLNKFLLSLKEDSRVIFMRRYWFLDSVADISDRLGCSEGKVKTSLFRSRAKFRAFLEKEGYAL